MNVPVKLSLFGVAGSVAFAAAYGLGATIDPVAEENRAVELSPIEPASAQPPAPPAPPVPQTQPQSGGAHGSH